ncbi:MAG: ATP-binding cassette domain-containing protein [Desulfobacterales bacterium]|nr:ATP-binding cassette domain-containing protein [Desulfobacterales bacterium]
MIRFKDVHLAFSGKEIFTGFNLDVPDNEKLLISGPSGCGKTTLFRILLGFDKIAAGKVTCGDFDVTPRHIRAIRNNIFYLSQDIDFRNAPVASVLDEIFSFEPNRNITAGGDNQRQLMQMLDLGDEILGQNMQELSGGEKQRLGLLVGFLLNRRVWLLDEPTSSLDEKLKDIVLNHVMSSGKTVIIISHDDIWRRNSAIRIERWP